MSLQERRHAGEPGVGVLELVVERGGESLMDDQLLNECITSRERSDVQRYVNVVAHLEGEQTDVMAKSGESSSLLFGFSSSSSEIRLINTKTRSRTNDPALDPPSNRLQNQRADGVSILLL